MKLSIFTRFTVTNHSNPIPILMRNNQTGNKIVKQLDNNEISLIMFNDSINFIKFIYKKLMNFGPILYSGCA